MKHRPVSVTKFGAIELGRNCTIQSQKGFMTCISNGVSSGLAYLYSFKFFSDFRDMYYFL